MPARRLLIWVASVLLVGCTASTTTGETTPAPTSAPATSTPATTSTPQPAGGTIVEKTVATNLDHPATFVLDRTGAIYYGERLTGEIRRIDPKTGKNTSVFTIPGVVGDVTNEQGLVGLTLPPSFPQTAVAVRLRHPEGQRRRAGPDPADQDGWRSRDRRCSCS